MTWKESLGVPLEEGGIGSTIIKKAHCDMCGELFERPGSNVVIKNNDGKVFCSYHCLFDYEKLFKWVTVVFKDNSKSCFGFGDDYLKDDEIHYSDLQLDLINGKAIAVFVEDKQIKYKNIDDYTIKNFRKEIKRKW